MSLFAAGRTWLFDPGGATAAPITTLSGAWSFRGGMAAAAAHRAENDNWAWRGQGAGAEFTEFRVEEAMKINSVLFASACLLAACSPPAPQQGANGSSSANAPANSGASVGTALQPGQYRTTVSVVSMNMPGMPAGMAEKMRSAPHVSEDCVTSEDVAELTRKSLVNEDSDQHCSQNSITSANGRIDGTATCTNGDGGSYTMQMHGAYGANHVEMDMTMSGQTPMGPMQQQMHMVTERIGECHGTSTN